MENASLADKVEAVPYSPENAASDGCRHGSRYSRVLSTWTAARPVVLSVSLNPKRSLRVFRAASQRNEGPPTWKPCPYLQGGESSKVACLQRVTGLHEMLNRRQAVPLLGTQLRVPHVHDENQPERRGVLPHLVLKRVIEDEHLAFFPCPGTETHGFRCLRVNPWLRADGHFRANLWETAREVEHEARIYSLLGGEERISGFLPGVQFSMLSLERKPRAGDWWQGRTDLITGFAIILGTSPGEAHRARQAVKGVHWRLRPTWLPGQRLPATLPGLSEARLDLWVAPGSQVPLCPAGYLEGRQWVFKWFSQPFALVKAPFHGRSSILWKGRLGMNFVCIFNVICNASGLSMEYFKSMQQNILPGLQHYFIKYVYRSQGLNIVLV